MKIEPGSYREVVQEAALDLAARAHGAHKVAMGAHEILVNGVGAGDNTIEEAALGSIYLLAQEFEAIREALNKLPYLEPAKEGGTDR